MEKRNLEESLSEFLAGAWRWIDPSEYTSCWAIDALCAHLEAVTFGEIKRLLVNFPPRCGKTNCVSIAWPAFIWAQREKSIVSGPQVRFLCSSYAHTLGLANANKMRRLITSPWYQERWGKTFSLRDDQNTKLHFDNTLGGARITTSVGGSLLGVGGDIIIVDDPHDTEKVESETQRDTVINHWKEISSTRLNDPDDSAIVVVMQRLHDEDVSGQITKSDEYERKEWTHLMLPMRYERARHCHTVLAWEEDDDANDADLDKTDTSFNETPTSYQDRVPVVEFDDPRTDDGELMWPARFDESAVKSLEKKLGPYMASGRLQQSPNLPGGGIIKEEWWQLWPHEAFPMCEFILASLDTAYTEKQENDPSALTIWGVFRDKQRNPKVILLFAWEGRLELHDLVQCTAAVCTSKKINRLTEDQEKAIADQLTDAGSKVKFLPRFPVDRLIIELKAAGHSVAQELNRLYNGAFGVEGIKLNANDGDKMARLYAVQHLFADQCVYAPDRRFAEMVIKQVSMFPKGAHDDLVDTTTMALKYLRETGLLMRRDEAAAEYAEELRFKPRQLSLY